MFSYLIRRIIYAIPILIGVNFITFALFFMVNSPDNIARAQLGSRHITTEQIQGWKKQHGYDAPLFKNNEEKGLLQYTHTLFFEKSLQLFRFNFGKSDQGRDISKDIGERMWPSLALAIPTLLVGLFLNVTIALFVSLFRGSFFDRSAMILCVAMMSISGLFYVIIGQFIFAKMLQWVPISGYQSGWQAWRFLILPIMIGVMSGIAAGTRWYRVIFLEEMSKDYVRSARAKGLSAWIVLTRHILKNGLIPILTGLVVVIPMLFLGSLIMESFFGVPGLGSYTIDAIQAQDFEIVRAMVFLGTVLYIIGLILTDVSYTLVDPRVKLE